MHPICAIFLVWTVGATRLFAMRRAHHDVRGAFSFTRAASCVGGDVAKELICDQRMGLRSHKLIPPFNGAQRLIGTLDKPVRMALPSVLHTPKGLDIGARLSPPCGLPGRSKASVASGVERISVHQ